MLRHEITPSTSTESHGHEQHDAYMGDVDCASRGRGRRRGLPHWCLRGHGDLSRGPRGFFEPSANPAILCGDKPDDHNDEASGSNKTSPMNREIRCCAHSEWHGGAPTGFRVFLTSRCTVPEGRERGQRPNVVKMPIREKGKGKSTLKDRKVQRSPGKRRR